MARELTEDYRELVLPALKVSQNIGEFYVASISAKNLIDITHFDIRRIVDDGIDSFIGIQRRASKKRVAEIAEYVATVDATFPTSVILSVDERCVDIEVEKCKGLEIVRLTLHNYISDDPEEESVFYRQIAKVLDGQHRIEGLKSSPHEDFELNISIFVGADVAMQATIFSVVNLAQTKVNHSLVFDLLSYEERRSPEKTCHEVAVTLDSEEESPFYHRIKRLGVATQGRKGETLAQASFVRGLLPHITRDPVGERDKLARGDALKKITKEEKDSMVFREYFLAKDDDAIADQLWEFFDAVKEQWPKAWKALPGEGLVLNKTTGYAALMRALPDYLRQLRRGADVVTADQFLPLLAKVKHKGVKLKDADFTTDEYKPGSSGVRLLYDELKAALD